MANRIAKMNQSAKAIYDAGTGYNQARRTSFIDIPNRRIIPNQDGDCSAVCGAIAYLAGYPIKYDANFYTWTMKERMVKAGFTVIPFEGLWQLKVGDFVVREGYHVEYVPAPGKMFSADYDENGNFRGGRPGNQTGMEVKYKSAYNYRWEYILRPPIEKKEKGFLMALTDKQQKELYEAIKHIKTKQGTNTRRIRQLKDYVTEGGPDKDAPTILKKIVALISDNKREDPSLLRAVLAKLNTIEKRLDDIEFKRG